MQGSKSYWRMAVCLSLRIVSLWMFLLHMAAAGGNTHTHTHKSEHHSGIYNVRFLHTVTTHYHIIIFLCSDTTWAVKICVCVCVSIKLSSLLKKCGKKKKEFNFYYPWQHTFSLPSLSVSVCVCVCMCECEPNKTQAKGQTALPLTERCLKSTRRTHTHTGERERRMVWFSLKDWSHFSLSAPYVLYLWFYSFYS